MVILLLLAFLMFLETPLLLTLLLVLGNHAVAVVPAYC
jgi:hypothetical protein